MKAAATVAALLLVAALLILGALTAVLVHPFPGALLVCMAGLFGYLEGLA